MSQENESDLSTTFSTLNVNAMEFVPSFCVPPATATESPQSTPKPADVESSPVVSLTPTEELTTLTATAIATATPTDIIEDKTPENPGKQLLIHHANNKKKKSTSK